VIARSYLFVPGNKPALMVKALNSDADAVIFDLEDAVPPQDRDEARGHIVDALRRTEHSRRIWVRVNRAGTDECHDDLAAVGPFAGGIRVPKVEAAAELEWVSERVCGVPLIAAVESAQGLSRATEIASCPNLVSLALGGVDLMHDLGCSYSSPILGFARCQLVVASRAAGLPGPINSLYPNLDDIEGLRRHAEEAAVLGFRGQSVVSPRQVAVVNEVYSANAELRAWAVEVIEAFDASGGQPTRTSTGEFVDLPVARRARAILSSGLPAQG
jgi:citrate lyase subunit beta/citryl-CoA lyase